jgi:hypothetical protein
MTTRLAASVVAVIAALSAGASRADVVILANRSPAAVKFSAANGSARGRSYELAAGDLMPLACRPGEKVRIAFLSYGARRDYALEPNSIYFFHQPKDTKKLDLEQIAISNPKPGRPPPEAQARAVIGASAPEATTGRPPLTKVKVKILVDDDENAVRAVWEERIRKRVSDASALLEKYAGVKLEIVACETWTTPNDLESFEQILRDFEANVSPAPADLAIGFASQYSVVQGRTHLGGTHGPLSTHILLREWSRHVSEPERLELLVHELGHRFGAAHSPEAASVMRPILGDRKAISRRFRIVFDPVNALAMYLVAEELRERQIEHLYQVSPRIRDVLVSIYLTLGKAFPEDPAATQYLAMLGEAPPATVRSGRARAATLIDSARQVRDAVVDVADRNRRLPRAAAEEGGAVRIAGDLLTEMYVSAAAKAALDLPEAHRQKAFALGLVVALVDTDALRSNSLTRELLPHLETTEERDRRLSVIGAPTIQGRNDLVRHFVLSLAIAALSSSSISESAGLLKEMQDAQGPSGFSFTDLAADLAGIALADYLRDSEPRLRELAASFPLERFVPSVKDLRDGLPAVEFKALYGSTSDPRFVKELEEVRARVKKLPVYAKRAAAAK